VTEVQLPDRTNPKECLEWALRTLDWFSGPQNRNALGADQIRGIARNLLAAALKEDPKLHAHPMLRKNGMLYRRRIPGEKKFLDKLLAPPGTTPESPSL